MNKLFSDIYSENKYKFLISSALLEISGKAVHVCGRRVSPDDFKRQMSSMRPPGKRRGAGGAVRRGAGGAQRPPAPRRRFSRSACQAEAPYETQEKLITVVTQ